jgi:hypothetical protein
MVEINNTWTSKNKNIDQIKNKELANLEGQWNLEINISTTSPFEYLSGPIEIKTIPTKINQK